MTLWGQERKLELSGPTLIKDRQVLMVLEKVLGHLFNEVGFFKKKTEMAFFLRFNFN